jgi:thiol-disulfide isomerase/thioredoxin
VRPELADLEVPRLVIAGAEDAIPLEGVREWVAGLPNACLVVIPESGHWPFVEGKERFFGAVEAFLDGGWPEGGEGEACAAAATTGPEGGGAGLAALDAARAAYREAGGFRETLEFELVLPDGRREQRQQDYGVGEEGAFLAVAAGGEETLRITAAGDRMVGLQFGDPRRYAEVPYDGDFTAALERLGGVDMQLETPPAVVAAQGGDRDAFLDALRSGVLAPLEVFGFRPAAAGIPSADEVELRAANGRAVIGLDPATHRLRTMRMTVGEGEQQMQAVGRFHFQPGDPVAALRLPDLAGGTAVATLAALRSGDFPLGEPAPAVTLISLGGDSVRLADLRGQVVVLDFWATWCVPCWKGLEHTAELAAWAAASGLPIRVFAVNTLERIEDPVEQRRLAGAFLRSRKIEVPAVIDPGGAAFAALHSPGLPSLIVIDPTGRLARYHPGLRPGMTETVKAEVGELLAAP